MTDTAAAPVPLPPSSTPSAAASPSPQELPFPASAPDMADALAGNGHDHRASPPSRRFIVAMTLAAAATVTIALAYLAVGAVVFSAPLWLPSVLGADGLE